MADTYIWIQLLEKDKIKFSNPLKGWIGKRFPGIDAFDFDNYSEQFIVDKIIDQAAGPGKLIVEIHATDKIETGPVTRFMNRLARLKANTMIIFSGRNSIIEKMTSVFEKKSVLINPDPIQTKEAIIDFLENQPRL